MLLTPQCAFRIIEVKGSKVFHRNPLARPTTIFRGPGDVYGTKCVGAWPMGQYPRGLVNVDRLSLGADQLVGFGRSRRSAMRTRVASESAPILCMTCDRCTLMV